MAEQTLVSQEISKQDQPVENQVKEQQNSRETNSQIISQVSQQLQSQSQFTQEDILLKENSEPKKRQKVEHVDTELTIQLAETVRKMQESSKNKVLLEACRNFPAVKRHRDQLLVRIAELDRNFAEWMTKIANEDQLPVNVEDLSDTENKVQ